MKIECAQHQLDGIAVTDLLAYWRAGHGATGA
jgi:hypothetical protein